MTKKQRLLRISELIKEREIDTQEELTEILNSEGFEVSQATISRDIKELNIIKGNGNKKKFRFVQATELIEEVPEKTVNLLKQIVISITSVNNLIVIKSLSGNANAAASVIDKLNFKNILGTIAGDDTVLIISKSEADAKVIEKSLRSL